MEILNIGIMAHVDAGKTSLTERLLFETGVIDVIGSVDAGSTQTDSLALERQRGITIKAAVASFAIDDLTVNLIDTPGHPDFVAEVERALSVLDGAVLVVSAVEGVQARTRVLMRTLQRLRIPTLIFVNKIDRRGADIERVMQQIRTKLTPAILPMGSVDNLGERNAETQPYTARDDVFRSALIELLLERNETLLAAFIADEQAVSYEQLRSELATQTKQAQVYPVFLGSAITGAGVKSLIAAIKEFLPTASADVTGAVAGRVFKIERGPTKEKIAYVRMFAGTLHARDWLAFGNDKKGKVTAISTYGAASASQRSVAYAGQIAKLWGLGEIQIGDTIGSTLRSEATHYFAPPTLETGIVPVRGAERNALHAALSQLAEQDPLINLRLDEQRQELFVSLYGEVQKEVIQDILRNDFQIEVAFSESTTICAERLVGSGEALDLLGKAHNPFLATLGLRIEPALPGSGIVVRLTARTETIPIYVYKSIELFQLALEETIRETLQQGLYGWQVDDCLITITHSGYTSPSTTAKDFRLLAPLVLMDALKQAGTAVCEPLYHFQLEFPASSLGGVLSLLIKLRATPQAPMLRGTSYFLEGEIPVEQIQELQQYLPGLAHGEGVLEYAFERYAPLSGNFPTRARSDNNPLNRKEYLLAVLRRVWHIEDE
jgi:ribosomal protection tetracycline resistance protein